MAFYYAFVKPGDSEPTPLNVVDQEAAQFSKDQGYEEEIPEGYAARVVAQWGLALSINEAPFTEEGIRAYADNRPDNGMNVPLLTEFLVKRYRFQSWYGR